MIRAPKDGSSVVTGNSGIGGRTNELLENLFFQIALKIMFCTSLSVSERLLYGFFVVFGREVYACSRSSLSFIRCAFLRCLRSAGDKSLISTVVVSTPEVVVGTVVVCALVVVCSVVVSSVVVSSFVVVEVVVEVVFFVVVFIP